MNLKVQLDDVLPGIGLGEVKRPVDSELQWGKGSIRCLGMEEKSATIIVLCQYRS